MKLFCVYCCVWGHGNCNFWVSVMVHPSLCYCRLEALVFVKDNYWAIWALQVSYMYNIIIIIYSLYSGCFCITLVWL